jgi:hypothetical protein
LTILLGYNTPIRRATRYGTDTIPEPSRRRFAKAGGKFSDGAAGGDDIIHNRDMEACTAIQGERHFSGSFAQPGAELMLDGGGMNAVSASQPATAQPAGERSAQQVALIITPPPVATAYSGTFTTSQFSAGRVVALQNRQQQQARQGGQLWPENFSCESARSAANDNH